MFYAIRNLMRSFDSHEEKYLLYPFEKNNTMHSSKILSSMGSRSLLQIQGSVLQKKIKVVSDRKYLVVSYRNIQEIWWVIAMKFCTSVEINIEFCSIEIAFLNFHT